MRKAVVMLCLLALVGCKPKDKPTPAPHESASKPEYLSFSQRAKMGERIVNRQLGPKAHNAIFDSFYKATGDNDGYVCGKVRWNDSGSQRTNESNFYVYVSFSGSKIASNSQPVVIERGQDWAQEKYRLFCQ